MKASLTVIAYSFVFYLSFFSPFDKDDQTSSSSTVSKRLLSNQSPPDTPSMREQVFYVSHMAGDIQHFPLPAALLESVILFTKGLL